MVNDYFSRHTSSPASANTLHSRGNRMNILVSHFRDIPMPMSLCINNMEHLVFYSPEEAAEMREVHMSCE